MRMAISSIIIDGPGGEKSIIALPDIKTAAPELVVDK
jgi:hypothetical protein